jgi:hypothetical protein
VIFQAAIRKDGNVYVGKRHCHILHNAPKIVINGVQKSSLFDGEQGFIDTDGRFYDRASAAVHALECKQIKFLKFNPTHLFSEDLW